MTSAFDTIRRDTLLDILKNVIDTDELKLVRYLLSNTTLCVFLPGADNTHKFTSNIGTPQGDSLSPVLFVLYLEHALRGIRDKIIQTPTPLDNILPHEIAYADDVDFITANKRDSINDIQNHLQQYNLKVNETKTEYTTLTRDESEVWKKTKKVGSLLGDDEDINRRKQLSQAAMNKLLNVWIRKDKIKETTRLQLHKTLVKSILLYNCGTWGLTKTQEEQLNRFHRKQLKQVLQIKYPQKIRNEKLYERSNEIPIALTIMSHRWRLFGHILRRDKDIPANHAMMAYFRSGEEKFRGRKRTTLPITINNDLRKLERKDDHTYTRRLKFETSEDLETLRNIATDRTKWRNLIKDLEKAAQAEYQYSG